MRNFGPTCKEANIIIFIAMLVQLISMILYVYVFWLIDFAKDNKTFEASTCIIYDCVQLQTKNKAFHTPD